MTPAWYDKIEGPDEILGAGSDNRSTEQKRFDSGVFAAAEFVRRYTGDESLAWQVLQVTHYNNPAFRSELDRDE